MLAHMWRMQGMAPDLTLLHGEVLASGEQLEAFSAASLPARPADRFAVLFAHRQQWAADDLKPYIAGLEVSSSVSDANQHRHQTSSIRKPHSHAAHGLIPDLSSQAPGQSTESLLLRYTRATQPDANSTIVYSAR